MSDEKPMGQVIQIDEARIRDHLGELRGAARAGLCWHFCRPPVVQLEYEMDCRGVAAEYVA